MKIIKVEHCTTSQCPFHELRHKQDMSVRHYCICALPHRYLGDDFTGLGDNFTGEIPSDCPLDNYEPTPEPEKKRWFLGRRNDGGAYDIGNGEYDRELGFRDGSHCGSIYSRGFSLLPQLSPGECVEIEPPEFKVKR